VTVRRLPVRPAQAKPKKPAPDWEKAEGLYRAGALSLAEISARIGVTKAGILKHMRKKGITRDLTKKVRQATKRKLAEAAVNDRVNGYHGKKAAAFTEQEIVEANSLVGKQVVECHRRDIKAGREVCTLLIGELYQATTRLDEIEQAIVEETQGDATGQRRALMRRAVSLPSRAGVIRDLTGAMKNLQALERVAFGLDDKGDDIPEYETELKKLRDMEPPAE
jgi:hypothetical protein